MRKLLLAGLAAATVIATSATARAANLISNGDFGTGDFTDWTVANYGAGGGTGDGGPSGSGLPAVTSFNVTGGGAQDAGTFEVGLTSGPSGAAASGGASLSQSFTTVGGVVDFSASIAASGSGNVDFGTFAVLIDGIGIASYGFGSGPGTGVTLSGTDTLSAGTHDLQIDISRIYYNGSTPLQYITNIDLAGGASVPEPASMTLLGAGLFGLGLICRKRT